MQMENIQGRSITVTIELTDREREVSGHVCEGLGDDEIAQMLGISVHTVRAHLARIRLKYDCLGVGRVALANRLRVAG